MSKWQDVRIWGGPLVVLAALAAFQALPGLGFVAYDDGVYVVQNPVVGQGLSRSGVAWAFSTFTAGNWHPLTWCSHLLDVSLYGLWPGGHHLTSLLLHALNGALLFLALARLTRRPWPSLAVALLWAVHPLRVESVAWISERKDVLCGTFAFLALWLYARHAERPSAARLTAVAAALAAGLLAKPMLVTLPCLLLLLDYWPLRRFQLPPAGAPILAWWRAAAPLLREKVPLLVMAVAMASVTVIAQRHDDAMRSWEEIPAFWRGADTMWNLFVYIRQTAWPVGLTPIYPYTSSWLTPAALLTALVVVVAGFWAAWRGRATQPFVTAGWLWYAGMLVPVCGLIPIGAQAQADRYTYLPQVGLLIVVVWSVRAGLRQAAGGDLRKPLRWGATAVVTATVVFAAMTWFQTGFWRNSITLFAAAADANPDSYPAHYALGAALAQAGAPEAGVPHLAAAAALAPQFPGHFRALAAALARQGRLADAEREYRRVLLFVPDDAIAAYQLGLLYAWTGRPHEAQTLWQTAARRRPAWPAPRLALERLQGAGTPAPTTVIRQRLLGATSGAPPPAEALPPPEWFDLSER